MVVLVRHSLIWFDQFVKSSNLIQERVAEIDFMPNLMLLPIIFNNIALKSTSSTKSYIDKYINNCVELVNYQACMQQTQTA